MRGFILRVGVVKELKEGKQEREKERAKKNGIIS